MAISFNIASYSTRSSMLSVGWVNSNPEPLIFVLSMLIWWLRS
jgi:hypothetical protein